MSLVARILNALGGPEEDEGQLGWLEAQVEHVDDATNDALNAALQRIALDAEEFQKLSRARNLAVSTELSVHSAPPWRTKAKDEANLAEAAIYEEQTEILKARLEQSRAASKMLKKTMKSIASEISQLENDFNTSKDRASELSLQSDTIMKSAVERSLALFESTALHSDSTQYEVETRSVHVARTTIIDRFQAQMKHIDYAASKLPSPTELTAECNRLASAFRSPKPSTSSSNVVKPNGGLERELLSICEKLEADPKDFDTLDGGLPNLQSCMQDAWNADQASLLGAREAVLLEAISAFNEEVFPPLEGLHQRVVAEDDHQRRVQALVMSLQEEMHDMAEVVESVEAEKTEAAVLPSDDAELYVQLVALLKELQESRPPDAPPLVLLSEDDVLEELQRIYDAPKSNSPPDLLPVLRNLEEAHSPLLEAIYANAKMNTDPPFAPPESVIAPRKRAKEEVGRLQGAIEQVQDQMKTLSTDRAKRKRDAFVGKWGEG
ncbi:hypothetical protein HMN09_01011700 [Mycena chlorophos]|uniref:Uncharacterized protein n=1 Tax=Mycena chlorophos TaxID=658473 RepID=A0A8H6W3H0_MYCCL|nr:hypothetical protein HMN09_01011700 [Mycena chlorophos]